MKHFKQMTALLLIPLVALAGCGTASTPEAAYNGFKDAMVNEDFQTAFTYITAESQETLLSIMLIPVGMMKAFGQAPEGLDAVLDKHSIDLEGDPEKSIAGIKDKGACFADLVDCMNKQAGENGENLFNTDEIAAAGELQDVQIDGASATGTANGNTIYFTQLDGQWRVDLAKSIKEQMGGEMPDMPSPGDMFGEDSPPFEFPDNAPTGPDSLGSENPVQPPENE